MEYHYVTACTPDVNNPISCPDGWEVDGLIECSTGRYPGDFWRVNGVKTVCKLTLPGDLAMNCCNNVNGVASSEECKMYKPYSNECNIIMQSECHCMKEVPENEKACDMYIEQAPAQSYYRENTYERYPYDFPRYSYTTPDFAGGYGYTTTRRPYYSYTDLKHKRF